MSSDAVDRRTRGLTAIVIADHLTLERLRPRTWVVTAWRSFARGFADSGTWRIDPASNRGCLFVAIAFAALLALPLIIPIELFRAWKIKRHNRTMQDRLADPGFRQLLAGAPQLLAIDWRAWHHGNLAFAGTAIVVLDGPDPQAQPPRVVWLTVSRSREVPGNVDAMGLAAVHPELSWTRCRWEWEATDPFEAVDRGA